MMFNTIVTSRADPQHIITLLDTITHDTRNTAQPRGRSPDSPTQKPSYRQANPATRQPAAIPGSTPGSTWKCPHVLPVWQLPGSTRQHPNPHPNKPGSTRHPAPRHHPGTTPAPPRQPGNPTRQHPATRQQAVSRIPARSRPEQPRRHSNSITIVTTSWL